MPSRHRFSHCHRLQSQQGLSLLEALISIIILALGLLGLVGLQTRAVIMNQSAYYRSIAADLSADLSDRIRANRTPFLVSDDSEIVTPLPPDFAKCAQVPANKDQVECAPQEVPRESYLLTNEMREWNTYLRSQLPDASFTLQSEQGASPGFFRYTLTISWIDNRSATSGSESALSSYSTVIE